MQTLHTFDHGNTAENPPEAGNMGMIHDMEKSVTITELARTYGRKADTLYRKAKRIFPGREWSVYSAVTEEEGRILLGDWPAPSATPKREKRPTGAQHNANTGEKPAAAERPKTMPPAPVSRRWKWPSFGLSEQLAVAIYGHTALVWYEVGSIFAVPGVLAGVVVFAMKHAAVMICRKEKYANHAADALGVAFVLDALAIYVHYTAFREALPANFLARMGTGGAHWASLILGAVVACGAFMALYFTNKTANK